MPTIQFGSNSQQVTPKEGNVVQVSERLQTQENEPTLGTPPKGDSKPNPDEKLV